MDYWERVRFDYLVNAHLGPPDEDEPNEDALDDDTDFRLDYLKEVCGRLSAVLNIGKNDIYREYVKEIGDNFEIVPLRDDAKERWIKNWTGRGAGWICEDLGTGKIPGYSNILCYYGSSTYDSHQMSRLIDLIIYDCKEQGIPTETPEQQARILNEWANKQAG